MMKAGHICGGAPFKQLVTIRHAHPIKHFAWSLLYAFQDPHAKPSMLGISHMFSGPALSSLHSWRQWLTSLARWLRFRFALLPESVV